jgi:serine/threonine-protein kinase
VSELRFWGRLAGLSVLSGALAFFLVARLGIKGGTVTMPDLKGLPVQGASLKLQSLGLELQVREERYSAEAPYGAVLEQSLEPGAKLKRGRSIAVIVSIGNKVLQVPVLVGSASSRQARLLLEQSGLAAGRIARVHDETTARDTVLAQSPEPGTEAARGQAVSLLVSDGPSDKARLMPDLRGRSLDEARQIAARAGLVLRKVNELPATPAGVKPGSVVAQSLSAAAQVLPGTELTLNVAPGGASAVPARLARLDLVVPNDSVVERRLQVVVRDSQGERVIHNAMEKPGAHLRKEFKAYGPAKAEISLGGEVLETRDIP